MLIQTVSKYLETHKRLVIPQLGAFIVKEPGQVLFSELLKREDGVLRELLRAEGMNELEAAGEIDRFVFEIRHAVERGVGYPLHGFGLMKPGPSATIVFEYNPQQQDPALRVRKSPAQSAVSAEQPVVIQPAVEESVVEQPVELAVEPPAVEPLAAEPAPVVPPHAPRPLSKPDSGEAKTAFSAQVLSGSTKLNPEPYIKGLRYGKTQRTTNAYTYVGHSTRRWSVDRFLLLAIAAAAIAVAVIAFGYFRKSREEVHEQTQTEQMQTQTGANQAGQPNLE